MLSSYPASLALSAPIAASHRASYQSGKLSQRWVEVLVDCQWAQGLYTYRLPAQLAVQPGDILSVPFGSQLLGAIALRLVDQPPNELDPRNIRDVEEVISVGFFPEAYWELLNQVAQYYCTSLIQVIRAALPPGLLVRSQRRLRLVGQVSPDTVVLSPTARQILALLQSQTSGDYSFTYLQRQVKGARRGIRELLRTSLVESYLEPPRLTRPKFQKAVTLVGTGFERDVTARQLEVLEVLRRRGGDMWLSELLQSTHASSSMLKTLEQNGYIAIQQREMLRTEGGELLASDQPKALTPAQSQALTTIAQLEAFAQVLLHGVTGSGKTEVYLQAIAPRLQRGQSALVLVPEIGLTPQLTDRFRARFGNKVCVYHSALSDGERYDTWRQMLAGEPQVVIGTRSAVFAPLPRLGLIILDEEHDGSFKQDQPMPTYHARTVAQWRAELENCPLVLGSATPSLETWVRVGRGQGERGEQGEQGGQGRQGENPANTYYLSLPERILSRPLPPVEVVDMRQELQEGNRSIFSRSLQEALQQLQTSGQQGILFIHRRGHSTFVSCRSCGYVIECPHCDVSLAYHHAEAASPELLRCHYCNYVRSHPRHCPECSSPYFKFFGSGTQKVAQELTQQYPGLRFIRFDSDTTRTKGSHRALLTKFAAKEADLLVGTQMLTKGLDLPQVTLVGVVSADGLLHLSDYRASERAMQTLMQVAGRAGRGDNPGRVIVQTYSPEHAVIQAVQGHEYVSFTEIELQQRAALNYPPYGRLILLRLSSTDPVEVQNTAQTLATALRPDASDCDRSNYDVLGPAPASVLRVANRYRWQILLKVSLEEAPATQRSAGATSSGAPVQAQERKLKFPYGTLPELPDWHQLRSLCPASVSLTIDVDPLS